MGCIGQHTKWTAVHAEFWLQTAESALCLQSAGVVVEQREWRV